MDEMYNIDDKPVNCDELLKITTLSDLHKYAAGTVVRFPDFAEGQPFVARVKRPSLLALAKQGKVPNSLLGAAGSLFTNNNGKGINTDDEKMLSEIFDVCQVLCRAALVQPSYDDIIDAGMFLSDDQLMAIFNYTQVGVSALKSFRKE